MSITLEPIKSLIRNFQLANSKSTKTFNAQIICAILGCPREPGGCPARRVNNDGETGSLERTSVGGAVQRLFAS